MTAMTRVSLAVCAMIVMATSVKAQPASVVYFGGAWDPDNPDPRDWSFTVAVKRADQVKVDPIESQGDLLHASFPPACEWTSCYRGPGTSQRSPAPFPRRAWRASGRMSL